MTTAIEGLTRLTEAAKGSSMSENEDNKFPKRFTVSGDKIFQGETVYGQRTVDKMQAELAALRKAWQTHENMMVDVCAALAIAYEESTPEDVLAAVTALRARVDTLTAALAAVADGGG